MKLPHIFMVKNTNHTSKYKNLLFLLINAGLKCTTSEPELALAQLAWLQLQCTSQHLKVLVGLVILTKHCTNLVCLLGMEAT